MNKKEFEEEVEKMGLESVKVFIDNHITRKSYYLDSNRLDIYGIYKNSEGKYVVFYRSVERETSKELGQYETEEEAYDNLLKDLKSTK